MARSDEAGMREEYRGVRLHPGQSPARMRTVQNDIDLVLALAAIGAFEKLYRLAFDARASPESRLLAGELVKAAVARGEAGCDLGKLEAVLVALADPEQAHPVFFCSQV